MTGQITDKQKKQENKKQGLPAPRCGLYIKQIINMAITLSKNKRSKK